MIVQRRFRELGAEWSPWENVKWNLGNVNADRWAAYLLDGRFGRLVTITHATGDEDQWRVIAEGHLLTEDYYRARQS